MMLSLAVAALSYAPMMPSSRPCVRSTTPNMFTPGESCSGEKLVVVGATGYIGKAVVKEAVVRGYPTTAVVRDAAAAATEPKFQGANVMQADVTDPASLTRPGGPFEKGSVDVVVSCLASRSGSKKDSFAIDYQATLNCMEAARAAGARHFVMLSAFCVKSAERRDPYALQFQYAKKDMEEKLRAQDDLTYSIVRPTAFFKSVSGQVEVVAGGGPFVYFDLGKGKSATCNPIAERDLAAALLDTIEDPSKKNEVWNLGGPDAGMSMQQQGELVADVLGKEEAKLLGVPIGIFDTIINGLQVCTLHSSVPLLPLCLPRLPLTAHTRARPARFASPRSGPRTRSSRRSSRTPPSSAASAATTRSRTCSRLTRPKSTGRPRCGSTTSASRSRARSTIRTRPSLARRRASECLCRAKLLWSVNVVIVCRAGRLARHDAGTSCSTPRRRAGVPVSGVSGSYTVVTACSGLPFSCQSSSRAALRVGRTPVELSSAPHTDTRHTAHLTPSHASLVSPALSLSWLPSLALRLAIRWAPASGLIKPLAPCHRQRHCVWGAWRVFLYLKWS